MINISEKAGGIKDKIKCRWGIVLTFVMYLIINMGIVNSGDDFVFMNAPVQFGSLAGFMKFYYSHWSGRVIPHTLLVILLNLPQPVFWILNALFMTLLVWALIRFCTADSRTRMENMQSVNVLTVLLAAAVIFLPRQAMLNGSVLWKCAAVLYIWGTLCAFCALYPFISRLYGREFSKKMLLILVPCCIYGCSFEQTAAFMTAFMLIMAVVNAVKYKSLTLTEIILLAVTLLMTAVTLAAPGSWERYKLEIIMDISCYDTYTFADRVIFSLSNMLESIHEYFGIILVLISAAAFAMTCRRYSSKICRCVAAVPVMYYGSFCIYRVLSGYNGTTPVVKLLGRYLFNYIDITSDAFEISHGQRISMFAGILCICIVLVMLFIGVAEENEWIAPVIFGAAVCEAIMIGLSPSVNTTGVRGLFITFLFLLVTLLRLVILAFRQAKSWTREV